MADYKYDVKKEEEIEISLDVTITKDKFETEKEKVFKALAKGVNVPGFRKGMAPKAMVESMIANSVLERTVERILPEAVSEIIEENKWRPMTQVEYRVDDVTEAGELKFHASFYIFPEVKLPEIKKLDVKKESGEATDEEIEKSIKRLYKELEKKKEMKDEEIDLKLITDEWIAKHNIPNAKTLEDVKNEFKKTIDAQKSNAVRSKLANDILEELVKKVDIKMPKKIIDHEVHMKEHRDMDKIEALGLKWEDWLRQQKTDMETLKKKWREEIEKIYKVDFIILSIIQNNNLYATDSELESLVSFLRTTRYMNEKDETQTKNSLSNEISRNRALEWLINEFEKEAK